MILLHPHSQKAYDSVLALLRESRKAAVIHPTGTGKSYIAFRLAEDHASSRFLWLSPSEAIYKTQCQNVFNSYGFVPENVTFCTYARLAYVPDIELKSWKPDYIILDEFHRCGAKEWGAGIKKVLSVYPEAFLIGFSATNIRYLDNQRDMAIELFDGCIADQITLPEAIARGILPAPKYVISIYSYEKELGLIERRMKQGGTVAYQAADQYYQRLRRALDQAPSFGQLFKKHIPNPKGRYIAFCANVDHLKAMVKRAKEDFRLVDDAPHIYIVHEGAPTAKSNFEKYKADQSDHLKVLYCIDMLNEGVHVDDLSGVILFRPTISPIIYKQQIGRALSVGDGRTPVIFDVVNNFDGLLTVSSVSSELSEMIRLYRQEHDTDNLVDSFEVIDELRDCRELLRVIENALSSTWDTMYREAEAYYKQHGDLAIPKKYVSESGLPVGMWLLTQRRVYRGASNGTLTPERIEKLNRIGMIWEDKMERLWEEGYAHAEAYYKEHHDLNVNASYVSPDGYRLGKWISNLRTRKKGKHGALPVTEAQTQRLDAIGMIWSQVDYAFERGYIAAKEYLEEHGDLRVPVSFVASDGFRLGAWLTNKKYVKLTEEQEKRLRELGFSRKSRYDVSWDEHFTEVKEYLASHGDLNVRFDYRQNGKNLYKWLINQRNNLNQGKLPDDKKKQLEEELGEAWSKWLADHPVTEQKPDMMSFEYGYPYAKQYAADHGHLRVDSNYITPDGFPLGKWIKAMRAAKKEINKKPLTQEQITALEALGFYWNESDELWENTFLAIRKAVAEQGKVKKRSLQLWLADNRNLLSEGKLSEEHRKKLDSLGVDWARKYSHVSG